MVTGKALAAAAREGWAGIRSALDGWDILVSGSYAVLFAGLADTFTLGVACIVMGTLGLAGGLAGARGAEIAALLAKGETKDGGT